MKKMYKNIFNAILESFDMDGWDSEQQEHDSLSSSLSQNITVISKRPFGTFTLSNGNQQELTPDMIIWNIDDSTVYPDMQFKLNEIPFKALWIEPFNGNVTIHVHPLIKEILITDFSLFLTYYNKFGSTDIDASKRITIEFTTYSKIFQKYTFSTSSNSFSIFSLNISVKYKLDSSDFYGFRKKLKAYYGSEYDKQVSSWFNSVVPKIYVDLSNFSEVHSLEFTLYDSNFLQVDKGVYSVKPSKKYKNIEYISNYNRPEEQDEETKETVRLLETIKKRFKNIFPTWKWNNLLSLAPTQNYTLSYNLIDNLILDDIPAKTKMQISFLNCTAVNSWEKILKLFINKDISTDKCNFQFSFHGVPDSFISEILSKSKGKYRYYKNIFLGLLKNTNLKQAETVEVILFANQANSILKKTIVGYNFFNFSKYPKNINDSNELYHCVSINAW